MGNVCHAIFFKMNGQSIYFCLFHFGTFYQKTMHQMSLKKVYLCSLSVVSFWPTVSSHH